jgi:polyvinyl alcohol dehydrogenase (cytochrome)
MMKTLLALSACAFAAAMTLPHEAAASDWPMFGQSLQNLADNPSETTISKFNVPRLAPKWVATTGGDVSARAAVVDNVAYFPDWGGNIWALDVQTGKAIWHRTLASYGFPAGTVSRTSPAVVGGTVYIGTQKGAYLVAINKDTGGLRWRSQMDSHPLAVLTGSPAISGNVIYTGVSSSEEGAAATPSYPCCSFRGSALAVDAGTGKIIWKTFIVPTGDAGGAVWGSNPVIDTGRHEMFIGTGNNYSTPTDPAYSACIAAGGSMSKCFSPDDHFDSLLALNLANGHINWARRLSNSDDWNVACLSVPSGTDNCPTGSGPDYDFASAPQEFTIQLTGGRTKAILGAGQKSGVYSAFDPDNGRMLWARDVGPGSSLGGMEWGSASDGKRIYVAISNRNMLHYKGGTAGSWSALDPLKGTILWRMPDPNGAVDLGPLAVANDVVYAPSMAGGASQANMFALSAESGNVLWSFPSGASVNAGATIVDGVVYWGSGYTNLGIAGFTGNTKFYAFSVDGK